ncbi:MAG: PilZ domain-containing protein [Candidatus Omnitrophota bacterium]
MTERRKFKRFPIAYPLESEFKGEWKQFALENLSENGLAFASPEEIHENKEISLHIFLKKKMFNMKALVVYTRPKKKKDSYNIGVRFLAIPQDFHDVLTQEVEDIMQFCRESKLYDNKDISFKKASIEYLNNFLSS